MATTERGTRATWLALAAVAAVWGAAAGCRPAPTATGTPPITQLAPTGVSSGRNGTATGDFAGGSGTGTPLSSPDVTTETPPGTPPAGSEAVVAQAVDTLAADLGIDAGEITIVSVEAVTWNDGALGCPQPGMSYIQVLIDGYRIVLEANGTQYEYHSDGRPGGTLVRCTGGAPGSPAQK